MTDSVHAHGGKIILQLWHVGRISHTSLQPDGQAPVAPSAINSGGQTFTPNGFEDTSDPRALRLDEMPRLVEDFRKAAENAKAAGFDGVEVHAANGYLLDQFLQDGSNTRDDAYGGSVENRARLLFEVLDAVIGVWGADRVGIRLSPTSSFNGVSDSNPIETFTHVVKGVNRFGLAYLHMIEGATGQGHDTEDGRAVAGLRKLFDGAYIANNGFGREDGIKAVAEGHADAIAYGRPYIANPDLAERYEANAPLNEGNQDTYYGGDETGYTDYPALEGNERAAA